MTGSVFRTLENPIHPSNQNLKSEKKKKTMSSSDNTNAIAECTKQLRRHEVAIAELNNLPSSSAVYQKNCNLYFRTTIQKATTTEQKQLDSVKAKLRNLNPSS
ncbi:uncharacterized protein LOC127741107 [Arachis duranensis]|uniref:Uncharacterized protein LOC127741107 n=1 Tax=Arachis duranensis TaxID=130453 RepID=A0A9C6T769_ARADU|nr:uncharacterized protein LOC127741107 [Arachis duranensis]